jgi:hypothetical protein
MHSGAMATPRDIMFKIAALPVLLMYGVHVVVHGPSRRSPPPLPRASSPSLFSTVVSVDTDLECCADQAGLAKELSLLIQARAQTLACELRLR